VRQQARASERSQTRAQGAAMHQKPETALLVAQQQQAAAVRVESKTRATRARTHTGVKKNDKSIILQKIRKLQLF
jgi:hypothetical protein